VALLISGLDEEADPGFEEAGLGESRDCIVLFYQKVQRVRFQKIFFKEEVKGGSFSWRIGEVDT